MRHLLFVGAALLTLVTIGCAGSPATPTSASAPIGPSIQNYPPWHMDDRDPVLPVAGSVVAEGTPYRVAGGVTGRNLWQWAILATWLVRDDGQRLLIECGSSSDPDYNGIGTLLTGTFNSDDVTYLFAKGHTLNATVLYEAWASAPPAALRNPNSPHFCAITSFFDDAAQRQDIAMNWAVR